MISGLFWQCPYCFHAGQLPFLSMQESRVNEEYICNPIVKRVFFFCRSLPRALESLHKNANKRWQQMISSIVISTYKRPCHLISTPNFGWDFPSFGRHRLEKLFLRGWQCRQPLISEIFLRKNSLFSKREEEKRDWGGGLCRYFWSIFLTSLFLPHPCSSMGVEGGGGWWPLNGVALELCKGGNRVSFWTESL